MQVLEYCISDTAVLFYFQMVMRYANVQPVALIEFQGIAGSLY